MIPEMYKHQREVVERVQKSKEIALFHGLGSGKTRSVIECLRWIFNEKKEFKRTLIVGPTSVIYNWKNEIIKYSKIPEERIYVCTSGALRDSKLQRAIDGGAMVITINYEALVSAKIKGVLLSWVPQILVGDEIHLCKGFKSIRSKVMFELAQKSEYRFILTGTPILQNTMDLFQEFKILDLGKTFGKNFFTFRAEFFMDKNAAWASSPNHFPLWVPRPDKEKELLDRVSRKAHVVYTKDCIDLPPYIEKTEYVEMTADQRKAYEQMKDFFMTFIQENSSNPAVASIAPVKALRMLQIVSGHLTLEDKTNYVFQGTPKLKRLEELLEEIVGHSKVVIWTTFKEDIRLIGKMLQENKWRFVVLSGDQDTQEKQQALDSFKIDPEISVMLANRKAGGTGCEMTAASYSISFSRGFSLGEELQSRARTYRGGSQIHEKIYHIDLCVKDSIDELVVQAIANKEDIGKKVLEAAKNKNLK